MPTKNRGKGTRSTARRTSQPAATVRRAKGSAPAARKKTAARAKGNASAKRAAGASHELATLKREKITLEKRLTDTVHEIAQLRHHEARVTHLERQLKERDETIAQLRTQLGTLRDRQLDDDEVQPSLALGSRSVDDLDEFGDDETQDDDDELI